MSSHLVLAIMLWFLFILQGSHTASSLSDLCSSITYNYSSDSYTLTLLTEDITTMPINCSCEISADDATLACSFYSCSSCPTGNGPNGCTSVPDAACFCTSVTGNLFNGPTCITTYLSCPSVISETPVCQTLKMFSKRKLCGAGQETKDLVLISQPIEIESDDEISKHVSKEWGCTARTVTPDASRTTLRPAASIYSSASTTAIIEYRSDTGSTPNPVTTPARVPMILNMTTEPQHTGMKLDESERIIRIGVGVGVGFGGGVLLIIAIIVVIFILRRRRAESNKLHANDASQAAAAASSETAYESYTIPVSAAYDNATNGTTLNYESIADDNEEVGESSHEYTEVKEISDHNGYDNSEMGRSDAYSMCQETGKDYEIVSENPTANIESETTVIDNEFYA